MNLQDYLQVDIFDKLPIFRVELQVEGYHISEKMKVDQLQFL